MLLSRILTKTAMIRFVLKKGKSPIQHINHRPISLLEVSVKLFERIIQGRLNTFIAENKIIQERQYGFRTYIGTHTAIATTYETIANALADIKTRLCNITRRSQSI